MFSHLKGMSLRELKDAAIEQQNAMDASYVFIIALTVKSMHSFYESLSSPLSSLL